MVIYSGEGPQTISWSQVGDPTDWSVLEPGAITWVDVRPGETLQTAYSRQVGLGLLRSHQSFDWYLDQLGDA